MNFNTNNITKIPFIRMHLLAILLIAVILLPILVFICKITSLELPTSNQWIKIGLLTFIQAGLSGLLSMLFGILGALGLCFISKYKYHWTGELFCISPALLPPLVSVLAWMNISEIFFRFPFSFTAVVIVHTLMNTGLVSVAFSRLLCQHISSLSIWAMVHNIPRWKLLITCLFYELKKEVILIFLVVFSFCFTSFSVPLLVGGMNGQTWEVLISEKLKNPTLWPQAVTLFGIEMLFLFLMFYLFYRHQREQTHHRLSSPSRTIYVLPTPAGLICAMLPSILLVLGVFKGGIFIEQWPAVISIGPFVLWAGIQSLLLGIGTGIVILGLLSWVAFCYHSLFLRQFLLAYMTSSTAFMGFCFLLMGLDTPIWLLLKWCLGLGLLFLPVLYRLMGESVLHSLTNQVSLATLMGASSHLIFTKILWPQCAPVFLFLSGVASFWAVGDFAYSAIVSTGPQHLALLIRDLLASYQLELASVLTGILILIGIICFCVFAGIGLYWYKILGVKIKI